MTQQESEEERDWREERAAMRKRIATLAEKGACYLCRDLETGSVIGPQPLLHEDEHVKVVLDRFPRSKGHAVVVFKPHRDDLAELSDREAGVLFAAAVRTMRAIKDALAPERVYLNAINDAPTSHVHLELIPRYAGQNIGPQRFVSERQPLTVAGDVSAEIRGRLAGA